MSSYNEEHEENPQQTPGRKEMSRRQFLTYTLGGATAYMAAGVFLPMARFAVDPILHKRGEGDFIKVVEASQITDIPQEFNFELKQQDGWYASTATLTAWIRKDAGGNIYALSPVCKHLGCTVGWNNDKAFPDEYHCPCHGARYTRSGKQLAVAAKPLDRYLTRIEGGWVYLGDIVPNSEANKEA